MAKKDNNEYEVITDKNDLAFGNTIYVNMLGIYTEHIVRKRLKGRTPRGDKWEETEQEYQDNYIQGWLIPLFKKGHLFKLK